MVCQKNFIQSPPWPIYSNSPGGSSNPDHCPINRAGKLTMSTNIKAILGKVRASSIFCQRLVYSMVLIIAALMQEMHFG
ncbi:hypothetical protein BDV09DRAFT_175573 [Aspergillus tetrazonus]